MISDNQAEIWELQAIESLASKINLDRVECVLAQAVLALVRDCRGLVKYTEPLTKQRFTASA
jgi:hypothetical protein